MRNVVPFKPPEAFASAGIDWTRDALTEHERRLREAYLTYETSCGPDGLVSLLLLASVTRRQGTVADDLRTAADYAESLLVIKLHKHRTDVIEIVSTHVATKTPLWQ